VRPISSGVTYLTGITQEMVSGQPRFSDQFVQMMRFLDGAAILGHNIRFDLSFLNAEFRRAGANIVECLAGCPVLDTVRIARRRFGRGGNSLPVLSRRLGVDPVVSHRALADAQTTAAVFERLLEPVGGYGICLCDALAQQGGPIDLTRVGGASLLPLELEEALEARRPVRMEYVDLQGERTERIVQPLHVRRRNGELLMVAHCQLRAQRRTFKLDRIVRLAKMEAGEVCSPGGLFSHRSP
jgi:DNA polymerase III epsilon subunit-like protein